MEYKASKRSMSAILALTFVFVYTFSGSTSALAASSYSATTDSTMTGGIFIIGPRNGNASSNAVWGNPDVSGVFLRIPWNRMHISAGTDTDDFDFSFIDHELDQAVKNRKSVSLAIGAGQLWTPDWIYSTGGVTGYQFQQNPNMHGLDSDQEIITLANPTDETYQYWYFSAIRALGNHIASNPEWMNAVAYVKPSGANHLTYENRLPNECYAGYICNTQVWAEAGYTPSGIVDFYEKQLDVIQEVFPQKPMIYALIQTGFPRTNDDGDYLQYDGTPSGGKLITGIKQTEAILEMGTQKYGNLFIVSHNGLQAHHDVNPWVQSASEQGMPTSFQTSNATKVQTTRDLQFALENMWDSTNAHYLEIYDNILYRTMIRKGELVRNTDAERNTLAEWNVALQSRALQK